MQRERNNNGITLLELIISMAISVIVVLMIVSLINTSFKVFRKTNDRVNLQMESQTSMNQLVHLIIESKNVTDAVIKQSDVDIRYQINRLTGYHDYAILWRKDVKKLYLVELIPTVSVPIPTIDDINFDSEEDFDQEYLLAEYVDEFSITTVGEDAALKRIVLHMALGDEEYEITKEITLRNAD